ncbi:CHASE3 domain-containing protein [Janthinobacterium agaricidamnosum]|uniref:Histidine kinase-, DNA gyrase B-, and HSP90-like ATPase family protein n=1 Tax=Janthinobacterium agaricidamnosum NBRC 102515 = DSM 9628 TaxID=1349767 RepID=W0V896_9BURK|nr:CHASE3 domain-containing protein [Janthinobacterium agaricidamnosum]CDG83477.1 histidine kinase-, DNA gyrase B-, and HSP90-like ATPase family protein [Janthinobacterium agaricidamnosum NBRC 102515 = DSM 9628]
MYFTVDPAPNLRLPLYKTVLCIVCALLLILNGFSLYHNLQTLKGTNTLLGQSARVADRLQYLNVLVLDAESSLRGYFISGSESYLGPSKTATLEIDNQLNELQKLLEGSPSQLKNLAQLRTLVRRKMSILNESIEVYKQGGLEDIVKIARVSDERAAMDEIRLQVVIMAQEQNEALANGSAAFYREYQKAVILGIGINALAILVLVMFYQLVRRSFQNRAVVEHALQNANDTLESTVAKRTEQLSVLSRHLISVNEEEKARLARELHDELGAHLTSISMDIGAVTQQLAKSDPELAAQLRRAKATLIETVELKRRIVEDLRPSLLDNLGLCAAIESYCEEFTRMTSVRCDTDVGITIDHKESTLTIALFRIVQESLTNIMKYAKARHVTVSLRRVDSGLILRIVDDGIGITEEEMSKPMSHGLLGMRERALLLGGTLSLKRGKDNNGTCVEALIPLPQAAASDEPAISSGSHPPAGGHTPSLPLYSTPPHRLPSLDDQAR